MKTQSILIIALISLSAGSAESQDCGSAYRFMPMPSVSGRPPMTEDVHMKQLIACAEMPDKVKSKTCLSALETKWEDEQVFEGQYMRVHPSGKYVLMSGNGGGLLLDLTAGAPDKPEIKISRTPLYYEPYPMETSEGDWRLIASPGEQSVNSMRYFNFKDVRIKPTQAVAAFADMELGGAYQAAAELPGSTSKKIKFRVTMPTTPPRMRDISVDFNNDGEVKTVSKGPIHKLCSNFGKNFELRQSVISKDGGEVAGRVYDPGKDEESNTQIFKLLENGACLKSDDLGYQTSKVTFSYPETGRKGKLTFTAGNIDSKGASPNGYIAEKVFVYDRDSKITTPISHEQAVAYGGFTRDGKLIYQSTDSNGRKGITIATLSQVFACSHNLRSETEATK